MIRSLTLLGSNPSQPTAKSVLAGLGRTGVSSLAVRGVTAAVYLWLVLLLSPDDLGAITVGLTLYGLFALFKDFGLTPYLVSTHTLNRSTIRNLLSIRLRVASVVAAVAALTTVILPRFYGVDDLFWILLIIAVAAILEVVGFLPNAILIRHMRFGKLAIIDVSSVVALALTAIIIATLGYAVIALFLGILASTATRVALLMRMRDPTPLSTESQPKEMTPIRYGIRVAAASGVAYLFINLNVFVLGRIDMAAAGFYGLAILWATLPSDVISSTVGRVMLPVYADMRRRSLTASGAYLETIRTLSIGGFLLSIISFIIAPTIIITLYGNEWHSSVVVFQILVWYGLCRIVLEPVGSLLFSHGKPEVVLWTNALNLVIVSVLAIPIAGRYGATGAAILLLATYSAHVVVLWAVTSRCFKIDFAQMLGAVAKPLLATTTAGLVTYGASVLFDGVPMSCLLLLSSAVVTYTSVMLVIARNEFTRAMMSLTHMLRIGIGELETGLQ